MAASDVSNGPVFPVFPDFRWGGRKGIRLGP